MRTSEDIATPLISTAVSSFNDERCAQWLLSSYSDPVWTIIGGGDTEKKGIIDFRYMMSSGRCLTESSRLYKTVKEFAWWYRDPRYSRATTVQAHIVAVRYMMKLAHALTLRNLGSFAHVQPYDIEELVEECSYGADTVLCAFKRVDKYLSDLEAANEIDPKPFGGLPQYVNPSDGKVTKTVHRKKILLSCCVPTSACMLPRVSARISQAAIAAGLQVNCGKECVDIPLLKVQNVLTIRNWLEPLELLYAMRHRIEAEAITYRPFAYGAARVAAVKGVPSVRTSTPPPMLMLHLLEYSTRWVFDHGSVVIARSASKRDITYMTTACWIIIAAFTARRAGEIDDLREGCLRGDEKSGWWLHVYIEKTLQRKEWIPVPSLVARAVETMSSISAVAQKETSSDRLFQWRCPDGTVVGLDVTRKIDDFAAVVKVPQYTKQNEGALNWHWHPHQFRRFFAVLYFYRYEGATIEVLSHHLRHFNMEMTKTYITQDAEVAALWTDVEWGYTGHIARAIVAGDRSVSGAKGERIKKTVRRLMQKFRQNLQIASPERLGASLTVIMQRQGLVLTPKPWVTCSCPATHVAASKAACRRDTSYGIDAVGPDFARASVTACCDCPHAIIEGSRQPFVDAELAHLDAAVFSDARGNTLFGELECARVVDLNRAIDTRYKNAIPLSLVDTKETVE